MAGVEQHAVDQHKRSLENVEEPLVADDGTRWAFGVRSVRDSGLDLEIFDCSVDGTHEDDGAADIERKQRLVHLDVIDAVLPTAPVESRC